MRMHLNPVRTYQLSVAHHQTAPSVVIGFHADDLWVCDAEVQKMTGW